MHMHIAERRKMSDGSFSCRKKEAIGRSKPCCYYPLCNTSKVKGIKIHQFVQPDLAALVFS